VHLVKADRKVLQDRLDLQVLQVQRVQLAQRATQACLVAREFPAYRALPALLVLQVDQGLLDCPGPMGQPAH